MFVNALTKIAERLLGTGLWRRRGIQHMEGRQGFPFSEGFRAEKEQTGPLKEGLRILNSLSSPLEGMPTFMPDTLPGWSASLHSVPRAGVIYPSHPNHPSPRSLSKQ